MLSPRGQQDRSPSPQRSPKSNSRGLSPDVRRDSFGDLVERTKTNESLGDRSVGGRMLHNLVEVQPKHGDDEEHSVDSYKQDKFVATVAKHAGKTQIGLLLDPTDGRCLYVDSVRPGDTPAFRYNDSVLPDLTVRKGDYVVSVNGVIENAERMSEVIQYENGPMELEVQRPNEFKVSIERQPDEMLGVELLCVDGYHFVLIEGIGAGVIQNWNEARERARAAGVCNPGEPIDVHDRIVAVNGLSGTGEQLMDMIAKLDSFDLLISRCPEQVHAI